ncbi:MAG: hypothetical protein A2Z83_04160 [Omnitrophica bacterium GWA2_52_8]|nr:MAG: hypothetical protein A2Z83_04160 [Omnitrophica bacterium GWA2_52_8]
MIRSMIFFPGKDFYEVPEQYGLKYENVTFLTGDGVELFGWYLHAKPVVKPVFADGDKAVLLYFHGNAGNISGRLSKARGWTERGVPVFLMDYRGYGQSQGEIRHQDDILKDAEAAVCLLKEKKGIPQSGIILYGESLGSYPAVRLACENSFRAVVLEAPYTSFTALSEKHYGMLPGFMRESLLRNFTFPNEDWIGKLRTPLFILHGTRDDVCPYDMGETLFMRAPDPKGFFPVPEGAHNDLPMKAGEAYWDKPCEFIKKLPPQAAH